MKIISLSQTKKDNIEIITIIFREQEEDFTFTVNNKSNLEVYSLAMDIIIANLSVEDSTEKLFSIMKGKLQQS